MQKQSLTDRVSAASKTNARLVAWFCSPGWKKPMCMGTISRCSGEVLRRTTVP